MIDLRSSNIANILPESLAEKPEVIALGYALNKGIARVMDFCEGIKIYTSIETLPEQVLDILAVEFGTQYYETSMDIETKRKLVKNTFAWYMTTGTPAAVEEAVKAVFGNGELQEWFEYGGEPYHFNVVTANVSSTDEMLKELVQIIEQTQNVRSYLNEVRIEILREMDLKYGCAISATDELEFLCEVEAIEVSLEDENGETLTDENGEALYYVEYV